MNAKPVNWKVGQVLYCCYTDEATGKVDLGEWHIRTIRGGKVHAVYKLKDITWGKRSSKHFDTGWLGKIPAWCRRSWRVTGESYGLFTTKRKAYQDELRINKDPEIFDDPANQEKVLRALKSALTRLKSK